MNLLQKLKNRKSRKQLIEEINLLSQTNEGLTMKLESLEHYNKQLSYEQAQIDTLAATVITHYTDDKNKAEEIAKESIAYQLAEILAPYITYECYRIADATFFNEYKYVGTLKVVKENN